MTPLSDPGGFSGNVSCATCGKRFNEHFGTDCDRTSPVRQFVPVHDFDELPKGLQLEYRDRLREIQQRLTRESSAGMYGPQAAADVRFLFGEVLRLWHEYDVLCDRLRK